MKLAQKAATVLEAKGARNHSGDEQHPQGCTDAAVPVGNVLLAAAGP